MKKITVTMIALCIALVSGAALAAQGNRIEIEHRLGPTGSRTVIITIPESALAGHCQHGDLLAADLTPLEPCGGRGGGRGELTDICHVDGKNLDEFLGLSDKELQAHQNEFSHDEDVFDFLGTCDDFVNT